MKNEKTSNVGERIKAVRQRLGLNQSELGEKLGGLAISTISGYESGDRPPRADTLSRIAMLAGVSLDWLITGKEAGGEHTQADDGIKKAEIAATFQPGNKDATKRLVENGKRPTVKNILLRKIVAWMDESFDGHEEESFLFYEDIVRRYPSFSKFVSPELPGRNEAQEKRDQAAGA